MIRSKNVKWCWRWGQLSSHKACIRFGAEITTVSWSLRMGALVQCGVVRCGGTERRMWRDVGIGDCVSVTARLGWTSALPLLVHQPHHYLKSQHVMGL